MTNAYTQTSYRTCVAPGQRTVVPVVVVGDGDYLIPIPFRARLVAFEVSTTVVVTTNDMVINIEKDAAGGTVLGEVTVAESGSAVGTEDTGVLTAGLTDDDFTIDNQDICLAVTNSPATGQANVFLIFEHAYG